MVNTKEESRTSVYLVRRSDALLGALKYFTVKSGNAKERRLQFLAQIDYWDWEMDNLIYSYTNFAERSKTWASIRHTVEKLNTLGIVIDGKVVRKIAWWRRGFNEKWHASATKRVAPVELLTEVVNEWNLAISLAEEMFILPMQSTAERWNIQTKKDLGSFRKAMPTLAEMDD